MSDMYFQNLPSTSTPITAENLNRLNDVKVSATEPNTGEKVWLQKGKNLFSKDMVFKGHIDTDTQKIVMDDAEYYTGYAKILPNKTYTISKNAGKSFRIATTSKAGTEQPYNITQANHTATTITFTSGANDKYVYIFFYATSNGDTGGYSAMANSIQVEQGSTATTYEAYIEPEIYSKNNNNVYEKLLLGKDIVESGSNYIKYADGTLICFDKKVFTKTWASDNSRITIDNPFTFPVLFNGPPTINMFSSNDGDYAYCLIYGCLRNETGITSVNLFRFNSITNGTVVLHYIAIGKWK